MDEPRLRCWIEDPVPPRTHYRERPGRWVAEASWPSPRISPRMLHLAKGALGDAPGATVPLTIDSPATVGMMAGQWCPHGVDPDLPGDQRLEAGGSLVFDTDPLGESVDILGAPVLSLELASDKPVAMVAACLSEVLPDGAATRVSYGLLNLTHRDSHEHPEPLEPGRTYRVRLQLNEAGHRFAAGNRIRLALSTAYWPIAWPAPEKATLTVTAGESTLALPVRPESDGDAALRPFDEPEAAAPLDATVHARPDFEWTFEHDMVSGRVTQHQKFDEGRITYNEHDGMDGRLDPRRVHLGASRRPAERESRHHLDGAVQPGRLGGQEHDPHEADVQPDPLPPRSLARGAARRRSGPCAEMAAGHSPRPGLNASPA